MVKRKERRILRFKNILLEFFLAFDEDHVFVHQRIIFF